LTHGGLGRIVEIGGFLTRWEMSPPPDIDALSPAELKSMVVKLFEGAAELRRTVAALRDEIARLKVGCRQACLRRRARAVAPLRLGGLRQEAGRRTASRPRLSLRLHPPHRHLDQTVERSFQAAIYCARRVPLMLATEVAAGVAEVSGCSSLARRSASLSASFDANSRSRTLR
jgi:hypothetical protein